jgi:CHASE2 domain-containing sensor protein
MKSLNTKMLKKVFATRRGIWIYLRHMWIAMLAFIIVGILTLITVNISFLNPVAQVVRTFSLTDIYYQALSEYPDTSHAITVVDMSELYTRSEVASLIYDIESTQPKTIGVDITFQDKRTDLIGNDMLVDIARTFNNIVFAFYRQDVQNNEQTEVHSFFTDSIFVTEGFTDMPRGLYGVMKRKVPLAGEARGKLCQSFSSAVVNMYAEKEIVPLQERDLNINFRPTSFIVVKPDSVLMHPEWFEGRIVLIGGVNRLEDMHDTPLGKMAGTVLLAYSIQTILEDKEVQLLPTLWLSLLSFFIVMLTSAGLYAYSEMIERRISNEFVEKLLKTSYVVGILISLWTAVLLGITFIIFCKWNININLGWAFAAISCIGGSMSFYTVLYDTMLARKKRKNKSNIQ